MAQRSKVTAEKTMPVSGSTAERKARNERPARRDAVEVRRETHRITEVQVQGTASHDHDDRYIRLNPNRITVDGPIFSQSIANQFTIRTLNLDVTGNKNALIAGTEHGDLRFAATEADRARFWVYVETSEDESIPDILARLPDEFTAVTQAPYWVSYEGGWDLDGNQLGVWARVTADVRDDLGPQQTAFGKG